MYIIYVYLSLITVCFVYHLYYVFKFYRDTKKNNTQILFDKIDMFTISNFFVLYLIQTARSFSNISSRYNYSSLVLFFFFQCSMLICFKLFLKYDLYSYNNKRLIGYKLNANINNLKLEDSKSVRVNKIKVVLCPNDQKLHKSKKIAVVTSKNKFDKLKECI